MNSQIEMLEQICLEDKYNKNQVNEMILKDLPKNVKQAMDRTVAALYEYFDGNYYQSKNDRLDRYFIANDFDLTTLVERLFLAVLPHTNPVTIQTIVGKLAPQIKYEDPLDSVKTASEIIGVGAVSDLFDINTGKSTDSGMIEVVSKYKIDAAMEQRISDMEYVPPLVCKPRKVYKNYHSAYFTKNESLILGKGNHHNKPLNLDVLNTLNAIPLSLSEFVLNNFEETSNKPLDTPEKKKNFNLMKNTSQTMYKEILDRGNKFWFEWKYDSRGRVYSCGYHINLQSSEYKKALIDLNEKQIIRLD